MRIAHALLLVLLAAPLEAQTAQYVRTVDNWLALAQRIETPATYRAWWLEIGAACDCAEQSSFEDLEIYVRPGSSFTKPGDGFLGRRTVAFWPGSTVIVIAEDYLYNERAVKHEILHIRTQVNGHPPVFTRLKLRAEDLQLH